MAMTLWVTEKAMLGRASMQPDVSDVGGPTFCVPLSRLFRSEKKQLAIASPAGVKLPILDAHGPTKQKQNTLVFGLASLVTLACAMCGEKAPGI